MMHIESKDGVERTSIITLNLITNFCSSNKIQYSLEIWKYVLNSKISKENAMLYNVRSSNNLAHTHGAANMNLKGVDRKQEA